MKLKFTKYQGTGNDFIIIDNRHMQFEADKEQIALLCDRKFGIGADGLMLLQNKEGYDFEMVYFNADGKTGSLCGNGGRCMTAFAKRLGIIEEKAVFFAADGAHEAAVSGNEIRLKMNDVNDIECNDGYYYLDTGSPHYVRFVDNISEIDVLEEGRAIRNNDRFIKDGTNVNFVEDNGDHITIRTYERGVEDETLSCGTGVTAAALCASLKGIANSHCHVASKGGNLSVSFSQGAQNDFTDIWLEGAAGYVFEGTINI